MDSKRRRKDEDVKSVEKMEKNDRNYMPFGFHKNNEIVDYKYAKSHPKELIPITKLTDKQQKELVKTCWEKGYWSDMTVNNKFVRQQDAINELKNDTKLGKELLKHTLAGYECAYKMLDADQDPSPIVRGSEPSNEFEFSAEEYEIDLKLIGDALIGISEDKIDGDYEQYSGDGLLKVTDGQILFAKDLDKGNIISAFKVSDKCKTWEIVRFPPDKFKPSLQPDPDQPKILVNIENLLKTFVCLYMVKPSGELLFQCILSGGEKATTNECSIGCSFVALQGATVFSEFSILSRGYNNWSIERNTDIEKEKEKLFKKAPNSSSRGNGSKEQSFSLFNEKSHARARSPNFKSTSTFSLCNQESTNGRPCVLLVDANGNDDATKFVYRCRQGIYNHAQNYNINHRILYGETATKENFWEYLRDHNIKFVCCAGHGNVYRLCGFRKLPILHREEVSTEITNGKIFHFLACWTGAPNGLGETLVSNGAAAFIGYKRKVIGQYGYYKQFEPDCLIAKSLLNGMSVEEAVTNGKQEYQLLFNRSHVNIKKYIQNNLESLVVYGNREAKLYEIKQDEFGLSIEATKQDRQDTPFEAANQNRQDASSQKAKRCSPIKRGTASFEATNQNRQDESSQKAKRRSPRKRRGAPSSLKK